MLDASKPHGQEFVFDGDFFFCFLFSKVLTRCFFLCFLLSKRNIYTNRSGACIRRLIGFLKSKGFKYNAQKFTVLEAEFSKLTGLVRPPGLKFRRWICYLCNTNSPHLPITKTKRKPKKPKRVKKDKDRSQYHEYLKSKEWETFRQKALDFYGRDCTKCKSKQRLQVHHKTYKNIFKEELEDVTILCETCHEKVHGRKFVYS